MEIGQEIIELRKTLKKCLNIWGRGYGPKDCPDTLGSKLYREVEQLLKQADLSNWELLEEERDGRMNVIAQNGNTGEHYENNAEECIGQECVDVNCSKHMV
jgi:hypothetical protein